MRIVPAFDELEDCPARFYLGFEAAPVEQFTFERSKEALAHRVIETITDEPIEGRTPASRQRWPTASEVY